MSTTTQPHLRRPRLTALLRDARIGVIEAAGGYGKSSLASEIRDHLGIASVEVRLPPGIAGRTLISRLGSALRTSGLSDLATRLGEATGEPEESVEELLSGLSMVGEPVLFSIDDVHEADDQTARLLLRLVSGLAPPHRAFLAGRFMPHQLSRLRRQRDVAVVGGDDLLFTVDETRDFLAARLGGPPTADVARAFHEATGGWAAAMVLSASLMVTAADAGAVLGALRRRAPDLEQLVRESLDPLSRDARNAVVQLAHLPDPDPEVVTALGWQELIVEVVAAGFPLNLTRGRRWAMPARVAEVLQRLAPPEAAVAREASPAYVARNDMLAAARALMHAGIPHEAAALLAGLTPDRFDGIDLDDLQQVVEALPRHAVDAHPRLLIHLARALEPAAETRRRMKVLDEVSRILDTRADDALRRELDAELARDLSRDGRLDEAEQLAQRALDAAADDPLVRARALLVLGKVASWHPEPASLARAEELLTASLRLCRALGQPEWASHVTLPLAIGVQHALGRFDAALRTLDEGLAALPAVSRQRAVVLTFRADVLVSCGRTDEAAADLDEAGRLAEILGDERAAAYVGWERAKNASVAGDRGAVLDAVSSVERHLGDWYEHPTGAEFLADAADALDRVGEVELAARYLERAMERGAPYPETFAFARANIAARACIRGGTTPGRPSEELRREAVVISEALDLPDAVPPREAWRVALIRAALAERIDGAPSTVLAVRAFDEAAALGLPELPLVAEPPTGERLISLAIRAGAHAAREALRRAPSVTIHALGGFEVRRARSGVELPPGKPEELVKVLVAQGGRAATEDVIEMLWPEVEEESGRKRLRNVLNRLRDGAGDVVVRDGEWLTFPEGVEVDALRFDREARRAIAAMPAERTTLARAAAARYRGELLPEDRQADWAVAARERLQRRHRALLEVLVQEARERSDVDEALRLLERIIESDPYDEQPQLEAASLLLTQGRRAAAGSMLAAVRRLVEELAIPAPPALTRLEHDLRA